MPKLSWNEVRDRAIRFSRAWADAASERADKQTFYNEFFEVFGIRRALVAVFEANVRNLQGNTSAIDLLWGGKLIAEHKSRGQSLDKAQSQAFRYIEDLANNGRFDELPRFVLVSDFANFVLYDLEPDEQRDLPLFSGRPMSRIEFSLSDFPKHIRAFAFMLGQTRVRLDPEDPANEKAYQRMCELHAAFKAADFTGHEQERLLVRILFCVFAEDTGIFEPESFTTFIKEQVREDGSDLGAQLNRLFDWLNNPRAEDRLEDTNPLFGFRYVDGGLFQERLGFAISTKKMREVLLECCEFHWAKISPAVFGSLFQGVMEDRDRRQQGAEYTSERDIMKVLRSLFLDDLLAEFERLKSDRSNRRRANLETFQKKLRSLNFFDPACGCGNFLVLCYRELRKLEIEVLRDLHGAKQQVLNVRELCKVDVDQFYGIEISEWPVRIAEVAMWLMDHQMNAQAAEAFGQSFDRLPLRTSPHIHQGNALRLDWNGVLAAAKCSYVLGNPPFVGKQFQTVEQKQDMELTCGAVKGAGVLDYVTAWYFKAAAYIQGTQIVVGFVSTNSISQGEQVGILWGELFANYHLKIHFAHSPFSWESEARGKAHVHVVIIGFAVFDSTHKLICEYDRDMPTVTQVTNISPYLIEGNDVVVRSRFKPISQVPEIVFGNMPNDGGHLLLTTAERFQLIQDDPKTKPFIRPFLGAQEFINGEKRWCLWLKDATPADLRAMPQIMRRIELVRKHRKESLRPTTKELASQPALFGEIRQPTSDFLLIPSVSSENRHYIPIGFMPKTVIGSNLVLFVPNATLVHFGVLSSTMHMAWVKQVCGRLESRYRYSNRLVYNNFPWPNPTEKQRKSVKEKAQAVIDARAKYLPPHGTSTLADLYDPNTMPGALHRAHAELDRAVEKCYRPEPFNSDRERVEYLFRLYEKLTAPLLPSTPQSRSRKGSRKTDE